MTSPEFRGKQRKKKGRELSVSLEQSDYEKIAAHCADNLMGLPVQHWIRLLVAKEIELKSQAFTVNVPEQYLFRFVKNAQKNGFTPSGYLREMAVQLAKEN